MYLMKRIHLNYITKNYFNSFWLPALQTSLLLQQELIKLYIKDEIMSIDLNNVKSEGMFKNYSNQTDFNKIENFDKFIDEITDQIDTAKNIQNVVFRLCTTNNYQSRTLCF